jgi:hypothetical protein
VQDISTTSPQHVPNANTHHRLYQHSKVAISYFGQTVVGRNMIPKGSFSKYKRQTTEEKPRNQTMQKEKM